MSQNELEPMITHRILCLLLIIQGMVITNLNAVSVSAQPAFDGLVGESPARGKFQSSSVPDPEKLPSDPVHVRGIKRVVVVAIKDILQGSVIGEGDVQEQSIFRSGRIANMMLCRNEVIGKSARYNISCGQLISAHDVVGVRQLSTHTNCRKATLVWVRRPIRSGAVIEPEDIEERSTIAFFADSTWVPRADWVVGFRTIKALQPGQIVSAAVLQSTADCRKNPEKMNGVFGPHKDLWR